MTKHQPPIIICGSRGEEVDHETADRVGNHIKSPAFLPCKEWSFPESLTLTTGALSSNARDHSADSENFLAAKPSSPHKLYKSHKFPSMSNLSEAAEDSEEVQLSSSPPKTPSCDFLDMASGSKNANGHSDVGEHSLSNAPGSPKAHTLDHTVGSVPSWTTMRKSRSVVDVTHLDKELEDGSVVNSVPTPLAEERAGRSLLFVLDMDHTMVGNLVALSDRDNIETNIEWSYWNEGTNRGLSVEDIIPYLERGMLRPGMMQLLQHLHCIGATVVVYTHSEKKWATKVCEAMQRIAGWPFITRLFSRMDCRDGHPHFLARKSLEHVVMQLHEETAFRWSKVELSVMFDDDVNALNGTEQCRLIQVPPYDYWEPCPWNTVVNEDVMSRNDSEVSDMVRRSVVEWGIAEPSYAQAKDEIRLEEDIERDRKWVEQQRRKQKILLSYNKVAKLDRVMHNIREVLLAHSTFDEATLEALPENFRAALGDAHAAAAGPAAGLGRRPRKIF